MISRDEFWAMADAAKLEAEYTADAKLSRLQAASLPDLRRICHQYRYFTSSYIYDLALLVARMAPGAFRSALAEILSEELGKGNHHDAHLRLYDDFLASIGMTAREIEAPSDEGNAVLLADTSSLMHSASVAYTIGLRGMGGECLCQVYLSVMHTYLRRHPWIQAHADTIDWRFWGIHIGEEDIAHREGVKKLINELLDVRPDWLPDLVAGYERAKVMFDDFWTNTYRACPVPPAPSLGAGLGLPVAARQGGQPQWLQ